VAEAAKMLARLSLPGLVVIDDDGRPVAVLPCVEILSMAVPQYCQDDPTLARVIDEAAADVFAQQLGDRTLAQAMPGHRWAPATVDGDATALEVAAVMAGANSPVVAIIDGNGKVDGVITLTTLLERVLG
jgi:CBS domain-containing protein